MDIKSHWENVYESKESDTVSWYQAEPARALQLLREFGSGLDTSIIDVGGGDSTFVDHVVAQALGRVTVLDISAAALNRAQVRMLQDAELVKWIEADITTVELPPQSYDVWHDRAVFHFLTSDDDRRRYAATATRALRIGGRLIISTFALDGPSRCSGLDVVRYSAEQLSTEMGSAFAISDEFTTVHRTPAGKEQLFTTAVLMRE
ncbi:MAG: class I SAM-dependent methyltransferase [Gemmatimonadota bacterium]|nr:class I SAM-dependent methyltransferase [Gemmatimonadota bacterium]